MFHGNKTAPWALASRIFLSRAGFDPADKSSSRCELEMANRRRKTQTSIDAAECGHKALL